MTVRWVTQLSCLSVTAFVTIAVERLVAIEVTELKQIQVANVELIDTARVEYIHQIQNLRPVSGSSKFSEDEKKVLRLNRCLDVQCTLLYDRVRRFYRLQKNDLRDIPRLALEAAIPQEQLHNVDVSTTQWVQKDTSIRLSGTNVLIEHAATPVDTQRSHFLVIQSGIVPAILFQVSSSINIDCDSAENGICYVAFERKAGTSLLQCDPSLGYRYLTWSTILPSGARVTLQTLNEYRCVDGLTFPFEQTYQSWDANGNLLSEERVSVKSARFNAPVTDDEFVINIPDAATIQDTITDNTVKSPHAMNINFDYALTLASEIASKSARAIQASAPAK